MAEQFYNFNDNSFCASALQPVTAMPKQQNQQLLNGQPHTYYCFSSAVAAVNTPTLQGTTTPAQRPQQTFISLADTDFLQQTPLFIPPPPPGLDVNTNNAGQPLLLYSYNGMFNANQNNLTQLLWINNSSYPNYTTNAGGPSIGMSFYTRNRYKPYALSRPNYGNSALSMNGNSNSSRLLSYGDSYSQSAMALSNYSRNSLHKTWSNSLASAANSSSFELLDGSQKVGISNAISSSPISVTGSCLVNSSTPHSFVQNNSENDTKQPVILQITNLDYSMDECSLRTFLLNQLKPITPVLSLTFESSSYARVTVPDLYYAKQVVANLHRKKIGHKRMLVSYSRDSALTEINTLRCQVAGLLKDVPFHTLSMYKFRELFQSRFKTSISVLDLYKMQDICCIKSDINDENKFISLQPELLNGLENSPLIIGLQQSVPYCTIHFKQDQHKGWAEQEIEPLPNVCMTLTEVQNIIYPLLQQHPGDIPVASLLHCIEGSLNVNIKCDDNGINFEHLVCCLKDIQIQFNNFGNKILARVEFDKDNGSRTDKCSNKNILSDSLYQISKEVIELIKMAPKCTMKFSRFIPAYHNHFGRQCRVADYGYTKLVELFEALSSVVQIMGDGENRQITLTHRTQIRRFINDLQRVLRTHVNKSLKLSEFPQIFYQSQDRNFDITEYGVCNIADMLDGLLSSNLVCTVPKGDDYLISIPQRMQTNYELDKTAVFAGEMVELFGNSPQYTIQFQKFVRSYHYHFAYQCRLSDYGFMRLADLIETISGVLDLELTQDEDKKIRLSAKVARRVFAEQCEELVREVYGSSKKPIKVDKILNMHKKKYGYQIKPQTLGVDEMLLAFEQLPYVELLEKDAPSDYWVICHSDDGMFRTQSYRAVKYLLAFEDNRTQDAQELSLQQFITDFNAKKNDCLTETAVRAMKHAIEIYKDEQTKLHYVRISDFMKFLISIVRLLEQYLVLELQQIKRMLNCQLNTTFEFGYPNLYTLLRAYPDIVTVNLGVTQERSQVTLLHSCELRSNMQSTATISAHKTSNQKKAISNNRPLRTPFADINNNNNDSYFQAPTVKARAVCHDYVNNNNNNNNNSKVHFNIMSQTAQQQQLQSIPMRMHDSYSDSSYLSYSGASQTTLDNSLNYSIGNKENSFNFSNNVNNNSLLNSTFNSSMQSIELNGSYPPSSYTSNSDNYQQQLAYNKLWHRRQGKLYQPQDVAQPTLVIKPVTLAAPNAVSIPQQSEEWSDQRFSIEQLLTAYEPPKPDTPPSKTVPSSLEPIFATYNRLRNQTININLPTINTMPKVLSPYSVSKLENINKNKSFFGYEKIW